MRLCFNATEFNFVGTIKCDLSMLSTVQAKSFWPALYLYTNKRIKLQKNIFCNLTLQIESGMFV